MYNKQAHPDVSKANKKRLCSFLDCQKLSPEVRSHASKNERLPLRMVVQVLFFEQEKSNTTASKVSSTEAEEQGNGTRPKAAGPNGAELSKELSFKVKVETEKEKKREAEGDAAPQLNPHNKAQMRSLSKMTYIKR